MRILLTEDDVSQALQDYISHMVVLGDNTESRVELAADGSAEVIVMPVGKPAPKSSRRVGVPTGRKSKSPAKTQKTEEPEPAPEPEPEPTAATETEAPVESPEPAEETKPVETSEAPAEEKKSPFSFGAKMKEVPEEGAPANAPAETSSPEARPAGTSIFSKVGKAG